MKQQKVIGAIKDVLYITVFALFSISLIIFSFLYIDLFSYGFIFDYSNVIKNLLLFFIFLATYLNIIFYKLSKKIIFKLIFITYLLLTLFLIILYFLKISGLWQKIDTVDKLRQFVKSFGGNAVFIFIFISFAQVVFLPIPSFITVGAGVLLFGPFKSAIYSVIGIIIGSITAYFIGKNFGYKAVKWLIGKDNIEKGLKTIKGKDRIVLTFMFLFPFFPDDVLCFIAGITTVTPLFFVTMIIIVRVITVFVSCYSLNNSLIPFNTWWGLLLWALFFAFTLVATVFICKKGDKIESLFEKHKKNRKLLTK